MKKLSTFIVGFVLITLMLYGAYWGYAYWRIDQEIDDFYVSASKNGTEILGSRPIITGFPGPPTVFFAGAIRQGDTVLSIPEMRLQGYIVPGSTMTMRFPQGLSMAGIVNPDLWSLDRFSFDMIVPWGLPAESDEDSLRAWQQNSGLIQISNLQLHKKNLKVDGGGIVMLDENLQPSATMKFTVQGHSSMIQILQEYDIISQGQAIGTQLVLSGLSKPDPETGIPTLSLPVTIVDRLLSLGPVRLVRLPEIRWGKRSRLAQHQ